MPSHPNRKGRGQDGAAIFVLIRSFQMHGSGVLLEEIDFGH